MEKELPCLIEATVSFIKNEACREVTPSPQPKSVSGPSARFSSYELWMCVMMSVILVVWLVCLSKVLSLQWVVLQPKQQGPQATMIHLILVKPQAMI